MYTGKSAEHRFQTEGEVMRIRRRLWNLVFYVRSLFVTTCGCWTQKWSGGNETKDRRLCGANCKCRCHKLEEDFSYYAREYGRVMLENGNLRVRLSNMEELFEPADRAKEFLTCGCAMPTRRYCAECRRWVEECVCGTKQCLVCKKCKGIYYKKCG